MANTVEYGAGDIVYKQTNEQTNERMNKRTMLWS